MRLRQQNKNSPTLSVGRKFWYYSSALMDHDCSPGGEPERVKIVDYSTNSIEWDKGQLFILHSYNHSSPLFKHDAVYLFNTREEAYNKWISDYEESIQASLNHTEYLRRMMAHAKELAGKPQ